MEKIENRTEISMEYDLLGEKFDLFDEITRNYDDRWERNQWNVKDFKITEHRRYNCSGQILIYCDVTNKISSVTYEDIWISPADLEDNLKMYDWGERWNMEKNQEKNYSLNGLERFGGIYSKLNDFYQGSCSKNDLKDELELMIIVANRLLKIPCILMDYIKKLDNIIGPYHWEEKVEEKMEYIL